MMAWHALASALLTPPGVGLLLVALGLLLQVRRPRLGTGVAAGGVILMVLLSMPVVAGHLLGALEIYPAVTAPLQGPDAPQAIVVLAGGRYPDAPEYGGVDTVSAATLVRLRYAAYLYRRTHLPVLVSGGTVFGRGVPESLLMRHVLKHDFSVPVQWTETRSRDTRENALFTSDLLRHAGVSRVYLVTQAWHMRRAVAAFSGTGIHVVPAPTAFTTPHGLGPYWRLYLPSAYALRESSRAVHEFLGLSWYLITRH